MDSPLHLLAVVSKISTDSPSGFKVRKLSTLRSALATIKTERFDLFIIERQLEDGDGIVLAPVISRIQPHSYSILVSEKMGWATIEAARTLGFSEVIADRELLRRLDDLQGEKSFRGIHNESKDADRKIESAYLYRLSLREREILADLATGATTVEIAQARHNSVATIKSHLSSIYRKLEVRNRVEAINMLALMRRER